MHGPDGLGVFKHKCMGCFYLYTLFVNITLLQGDQVSGNCQGNSKFWKCQGMCFIGKCQEKCRGIFSSGYANTKYPKQRGNVMKIPNHRERKQRKQISFSYPMLKNNMQNVREIDFGAVRDFFFLSPGQPVLLPVS